MSLKRQQNWLSQQQVAVPHLRSVESAVASDFDQLVRGWVTQEGNPYFVRGFSLKFSGAVGGDATAIEVIVDDAAIFHSTATEAGTILTVPAGTANEILSASNAKVVGSFVSNTTNFIAIDYSRAADSSTNDLVRFWDPDTNEEFSKTVPLARLLDYQFVISAVGFGSLLPVASVLLDVNGKVVSITDCRPMLMRLGTGGAIPDPTNVYPWPDGPTVVASGRAETPSIGAVATTPFEGGDKEIKSLKNWMDAMMSRIKEVDGGTYWYSPGIGSITGLAQNQNVHMLDFGVVWTWNLATETLTWSNTITFQIPGSTNNNTVIAGSVVLANVPSPQVVYVSINRAAAAVLGATVVDDDALPIDEDTFVFARRDGDDVIVGTHSFRVKPTDATESDYSDHLSKEKLLKPFITQAAADASIHVYPSQRVSGNKRRYIYIDPKESSVFPPTAYLGPVYAGDTTVTDVDFTINAGTLEIDISVPAAPSPLSSLAAIVDGFTPVLIALSSADAVTVSYSTAGDINATTFSSLALATADAAMPIPTDADYPIAVVVVEMAAGIIQPITNAHLLDRRPTGAGGSGSGGSVGTVVEMTAVGGELLIDLGALGLTYTPGLADLAVIENGIELFVGATRDYVETDATHITLTSAAVAGDRYKFRTGAGITPGSAGDVTGPAGATADAICRFNGATGKIIKNSAITIDGTGKMYIPDTLMPTVHNTVDLGADLTRFKDIYFAGVLYGGNSPLAMESKETDGAAAVGFSLTTANALTTEGSKIIRVLNDTTEYLNVRRGENLYGLADRVILELNDNAGAKALQVAIEPSGASLFVNENLEGFHIESLSDFSWGAGYKYSSINFTRVTNPNISIYSEYEGAGQNSAEFNGGQPGASPTTSFTIEDYVSGDTAELSIFAEDYGACNRSDVRFNAIAFGYVGLASTGGAFFGANSVAAPTQWLFESGALEVGAGLVDAYVLDTQNAIGNAGSLLLSLRNNTVPKFEIDKDGNIVTVGTIAGVLTDSMFLAKGDLITATAAGTPVILQTGGAGNDGKVLVANSAVANGIEWSAAGAGNVIGPGVSTDKALARWSGIGGTNLLNSQTTLDSFDTMTHGGAVNFLRATNADSAIALANALKATMNAHAASTGLGAAHPVADGGNFPVLTADATDLTSLFGLTNDLLTAYFNHNADTQGPLAYHNGGGGDNPLALAPALPSDLDDAVARLNDLKAKYNAHDADAVAHTTANLFQEVVMDSTGDYDTDNETVVGIVDTTTARAVVLSDTDKIAGRVIVIKDESGGATAMNITITPQTGTIDGDPSVPITVDYGTLRLYSDGSNWFSM